MVTKIAQEVRLVFKNVVTGPSPGMGRDQVKLC